MGILTLQGNDAVMFSGNTASGSDALGGAIYASAGTVTLSGNEYVLFEKNAEVENSTYRLRSIYTKNLNLSASDGKKIEFHDSIYASGMVNLNTDYSDADGVIHKQTGDIIFTGATTEDDLIAVKKAHLLAQNPNADVSNLTVTAAEIQNSRTSIVKGTTNLYGGRLRIEDGAVFQGAGLTVAEGSNATVALKDATMTHANQTVSFSSGSTLQAEGQSVLSAETLTFANGTSLTLIFGNQNIDGESAVLTYSGDWGQTGSLSLNLGISEIVSAGSYALLTWESSAAAPDWWTENAISVYGCGARYNDLSWVGNTLYVSLPVVMNSLYEWDNGTGDRIWAVQADNWVGEISFVDGSNVKFGNTGAGEVKLQGDLAPDSIVVQNDAGYDYTWQAHEEGGMLSGRASLLKKGEGSLALNLDNAYSGGTILEAGTLEIGTAGALGSGDVLMRGGELNLNGFSVTNAIEANGGTLSGATAYAGELTIAGDVSLKGTTTAGSLLMQSGSISGGTISDVNIGAQCGRIDSIIIGDSSLCVTAGDSADAKVVLLRDNNYQGGTRVSGGTLIAASEGVFSLGYGQVTVDGGVLRLDAAETYMFSTLSGSGGEVQLNENCLYVLDGVDSSYAGRVSNGSLSIEAAVTQTFTGAVDRVAFEVGSDSTLALLGDTTLDSVIANSGTVKLGGTVDILLEQDAGAAVYVNTAGVVADNGFVALQNSCVLVDGGDSTAAADTIWKIAGESVLPQQFANGALVYVTDKDATAYYINTGTETVQDAALYEDAELVLNGGVLEMNGVAMSNALTANGGTLSGASAYAGLLTLNGNLSLNGETKASAVVVNGGNISGGSLADTAITFLGDSVTNSGITGAAAVTVESGAVTLGGDNSYTGGTILEAGFLTAGSATAFGSGTVQMNGGALNLNGQGISNAITAAGGTLSGASAYAGNLTVDGQLTVNGDMSAAGVAVNSHLQLAGTMTAGSVVVNGGNISGGELTDAVIRYSGDSVTTSAITAGASVLVEGGTVALNGDNTYTGGTTLSAGTLWLESATAHGQGAVTVNGGVLQLNVAEATLQAGLSGDGGEVQLNGNQLYVKSEAGATYAGRITNGSLNLNAAATQRFTGEVTGVGFEVGSGSTLALLGETSLDAAIANNGTVELGGTVNLQMQAVATGNSYFVDTDGNFADNGFAGTEKSFVVVDGGDSSASGSTIWKVNGELFENGTYADGALTFVDRDYSTYYINSGTETVLDASAYGNAVFALKKGTLNLNGVALINAIEATGGTLNGATAYTGQLVVDGAVTLGGETTAASVLLNSGSLSGGSLSDTQVLITGDVALSSKLGSGVHIVVESGSSTVSGTNATTFGGTVVINGGVLETKSPLVFGNGAVEVNDTGALKLGANLYVGSLNGTGGEVLLNGKALTLTGSGEDSYAGRIDGNGGKLTMSTGSQKLSGEVALNTMTVGADATLHLHGNTMQVEELANEGVVKMSDGMAGAPAALQVGNAMQIQNQSGKEATLEGVSASGNTLSGGSMSHAKVTLGAAAAPVSMMALADAATYTLEDTALVATNVMVATEQAVLNNVTMDSESSLSAQAAQISVSNSALHQVTLGAAASISATDNSTLSGANCLTLTPQTVSLDGNQMMLSSSQLSGLTLLDGGTLTLDLSYVDLPDAYTPGDYLVLLKLDNFNLEAAYQESLGDSVEWLDIQGGVLGGAIEQTVTISYVQDSTGIVVSMAGLNVPEPTTATLSLLALAALAARRRRK